MNIGDGNYVVFSGTINFHTIETILESEQN